MDSDTAVAAMAALGHGLRLDIWRILAPLGQSGLPAGTISARLGVAPSSLSFHLHQMMLGRILVQRCSSRQIIYAVNSGMIESLRDFLAHAGHGLNGSAPNGLLARQPSDVFDQR